MAQRVDLAINGGTPTRRKAFPPRRLFRREELRAIRRLFSEHARSGQDIGYNGPAEVAYEKAFADFMGGGFADGVNSGTNALFCALGALQLPEFSEVIVPPITDPGGVMPVLFHCCIPIFADSDPRTYNTTAGEIEKVITERTRAIIVAHIVGEPVDMDPVLQLARKYNLAVIEDCAQAHGARYRGGLVGTYSDIAAFSTMHGKHHATGGQGGVVYTQNEELFWRAKRFADRGKPFNLDASGNVAAGLNCNLNDISAAIGLTQIGKLPDTVAKRRLLGSIAKSELSDCAAVRVGWQADDTEPVYWFLRIFLDTDLLSIDKKQFCDALQAEGVPVNPSYRHIQAEAPWYLNQSVFGGSGFPWTAPQYKGPPHGTPKLLNAIKATDQHFNIHFHEGYRVEDIRDLVTAIKKVERAYLKSKG